MRRSAGFVLGGIVLAAVAGAAAWQSNDKAGRGVTVVPGRAAVPATAAKPAAAVAAAAETTDVVRTPVATLSRPWAMVFLPDGRLLVTEKPAGLRIVTTGGLVSGLVANLPPFAVGRNAGVMDVALDPGFASNHRIWLTYAEPRGGDLSALALLRATLVFEGNGGRLTDNTVVFRQQPAIAEMVQYGGRIAFAPNGILFLTTGDRHENSAVQSRDNTLGKTMRIDPANSRASIATVGHRNPYGLVFTRDGRLYQSEMGPTGGDEFNQIKFGGNYGWAEVSEGVGGSGRPFPRHASDPRFTAPLVFWTPTIAPGGMIQYRGTRFAGWQNDFVLAALKGEALVRVRVSAGRAAEVGRIAMGARVREVEEGPDGAIWILEDAPQGRLVRLDPAT